MMWRKDPMWSAAKDLWDVPKPDLAARNERMQGIVEREAFLWGETAAQDYHGVAATQIDAQWAQAIGPILARHPIDMTRSVDFAAGYGRNTRKLLEAGAGHVTMIDVNPDCIAHLKANLEGDRAVALLNNGMDLGEIETDQVTFLYTFDAMVHFDLEIVLAYIAEFSRVLKSGGHAFIHHSNYTGNPGGDFRENPHWRNFMSAAIFKHIATRHGFDVLSQDVLPWGGNPELDCITLMRRA